jgi:homoserine O-succinyltransferase
VQIHAHLITVPIKNRSDAIKDHIANYYEDFEQLKKDGLDAMIISGATESGDDMTQQEFWPYLTQIFDWCEHNVASTICSCLATHAAFKYHYNIDRVPVTMADKAKKLSGLFTHTKTDREHPLMQAVNTNFMVPHSRYNQIKREDFVSSGCDIIVDSPEAGVHIASSTDLFRFIYFQGHPEYDTHSLLKEYKRDVLNAIESGDPQNNWPDMLKNYFSSQSLAILEEYKERCITAINAKQSPPDFPEQLLMDRLFNTWRDTCKSMMNNWIGSVYQLTNVDRQKQYMDGIDPDDPFGIKNKDKSKT